MVECGMWKTTRRTYIIYIYILLFALYEIIIYVFTHPTHTSSENYMLYGLQGECSKGSEGYHYKKRIISWKGLPNSHLLYTCSGSLFGKSSVRMWDLYFENNKNNIIYIYIYIIVCAIQHYYICVHTSYAYFKRKLYAIWFARRMQQRKRRVPLQKAHHQLEKTVKFSFVVHCNGSHFG